MRRLQHAGISFHVDDGVLVDRAVVYSEPSGPRVVSVLARPATEPLDEVRRKAEMSSKNEGFALKRSREMELNGRLAAEAEMAFETATGPMLERVVAVKEEDVTYVFDFCFSGPRSEQKAAENLFAFLASGIGK